MKPQAMSIEQILLGAHEVEVRALEQRIAELERALTDSCAESRQLRDNEGPGAGGTVCGLADEYEQRIAELEAERDAFKRTLDKRDGERDKLRAAAKAIIDDAMFTGAPGSFYILMNGHLTEQGDCDRDGCAGTLFADLWAALKQESKP